MAATHHMTTYTTQDIAKVQSIGESFKHTGRWVVDEYTKSVKQGRKIVRVPRAIIIEEDGTEDGKLIADDMKPSTAVYICLLHNHRLEVAA